MVKTNTPEQRTAKRSRRLQKKLWVGEFRTNLYELSYQIRFNKDETSSLEPIKEMLDYSDEFFESLSSPSMYAGSMTTAYKEDENDHIIQVECSILARVQYSEADIIEWVKNNLSTATELTLSEGKDVEYDAIWDRDDFDDKKYWRTIYEQ